MNGNILAEPGYAILAALAMSEALDVNITLTPNDVRAVLTEIANLRAELQQVAAAAVADALASELMEMITDYEGNQSESTALSAYLTWKQAQP